MISYTELQWQQQNMNQFITISYTGLQWQQQNMNQTWSNLSQYHTQNCSSRIGIRLGLIHHDIIQRTAMTAAEYESDLVQFITISYTELQWQQQNMNQTWSNLSQYHTQNCNDSSRIWIRLGPIYHNIIHRTAMTAAEYESDLVQFITISYTELQWQQQNMNQTWSNLSWYHTQNCNDSSRIWIRLGPIYHDIIHRTAMTAAEYEQTWSNLSWHHTQNCNDSSRIWTRLGPIYHNIIHRTAMTAAEYESDLVQFIMTSYTELQWQQQNMNQTWSNLSWYHTQNCNDSSRIWIRLGPTYHDIIHRTAMTAAEYEPDLVQFITISYTELQWQQQNMNQTWSNLSWHHTQNCNDSSRIWTRLGPTYHDIIHRTAMTAAEYEPALKFTSTLHTSPWRASYGVSVVRILEKIDRVITAPHCIYHRNYYHYCYCVNSVVISTATTVALNMNHTQFITISYTELQWQQQNMNRLGPIYHNIIHRLQWQDSRIWIRLGPMYHNIIHRTAIHQQNMNQTRSNLSQYHTQNCNDSSRI